MSDTLIYFLKPVGMDGPIKIGCSVAPKKRLKDFMVWSPVPLEIIGMFPGSMALERNIHECLHFSRSHSEWFYATAMVRDLVAKINAGFPIEECVDLTKRIKAPKGRQMTPRTAESRELSKWRSLVARAEKASIRHGDCYYPRKEAEDEMQLFVRATYADPVPAGFDPVHLRAFVSDPGTHGIPYAEKYGKGNVWPGLRDMVGKKP